MRNRPTPIYDVDEPSRSGSAWDVDAEPALRLTWLFVAMTLPLLAVAGRLVHLQWFLADAFAIDERRETVSFEPIPSRHGRILAADGTVLAFDEERFRVLLHYRWLEEPPNERWLRNEAVSRLSLTERRDKQKVEQAQQAVLAQRANLWQSLAELTDRTPDELADARGRVQQRVERIFQTVEEKQATLRDSSNTFPHRPRVGGEMPYGYPSDTDETVAGPQTHQGADAPRSPEHFLQSAWDVVKHELTTPPTRTQRDSLRIPEQADYHLLIDNVPLDVVAELETHPDQFPGVRTDVIARRVYPQGQLAPHLVGYRGEIDSAELTARRARFPHGDPLDYQPGDTLGRAGIEQSYEHILRGVRGQRKITRDQNGTIVHAEIIHPPRLGRDVVLGLNLALQEQATSLLNEIVEGDAAVGRFAKPSERLPDDGEDRKRPPGACLVAIDVQTGAIVAAATAPTFDVNDWLSGGEEVRQALLADTRRPMFPRVTQMELPPGSVFKTVSAVALLESGRIDPDRPITCAGYLDQPNKLRCYHSQAHYETDLTQAIARSCNVYFFKAARTIGPRPLVDWSDHFGFGQLTGVDVPAEQSGHVPRPPDDPTATLASRRSVGKGTKSKSKSKSVIELASHERSAGMDTEVEWPISPWDDEAGDKTATGSTAKRETWYSGDTLGLAIGQSRLTVTPLQIARLMAAVANDGWLVTPHLAREIAAAPETELAGEPRSRTRESSELPKSHDFGYRNSSPFLVDPPRRRIQGLSDGTLARVREGLEQVVAHPQGTGYKTVRLKEVAIAGKTGTAENGGGRPDHAWFAGYVPADRPQIAFVVVLEQGGSGGKAAGPVAKKFVEALLEARIVRGKRAN